MDEDPEIIETGLWCPVCLLPSAVKFVHTYMLTGVDERGEYVSLVPLMAMIEACSNCGTYIGRSAAEVVAEILGIEPGS